MLGAVAISERGISDQGVLLSASETASANFTKSNAANLTMVGEAA